MTPNGSEWDSAASARDRNVDATHSPAEWSYGANADVCVLQIVEIVIIIEIRRSKNTNAHLDPQLSVQECKSKSNKDLQKKIQT